MPTQSSVEPFPGTRSSLFVHCYVTHPLCLLLLSLPCGSLLFLMKLQKHYNPWRDINLGWLWKLITILSRKPPHIPVCHWNTLISDRSCKLVVLSSLSKGEVWKKIPFPFPFAQKECYGVKLSIYLKTLLGVFSCICLNQILWNEKYRFLYRSTFHL